MINDRRGFSIMETLISLIILSIAGSVIIFGIYSFSRNLKHMSDMDKNISYMISEAGGTIRDEATDSITFYIGKKPFNVSVKTIKITDPSGTYTLTKKYK